MFNFNEFECVSLFTIASFLGESPLCVHHLIASIHALRETARIFRVSVYKLYIHLDADRYRNHTDLPIYHSGNLNT